MDRDTKAAFAGVNTRLDSTEALWVKLVEGQVRNDAAIGKLIEGQDQLRQAQQRTETQLARAAGLLNTLAAEVQHLGEGVRRNSDDIRHLAERMDNFAEQVMRGFTKRDEDHAALEARVTKLEHQ